jgi:hypothetical protein
MIHRATLIVAMTLAVLTGFAKAADEPKQNPRPAPQSAPGQPAAGAWVGGGGGFAIGGAPGAGVGWNGAALWQTLNLVSELNMTPTFTLTAEQKEKIQAIREAARRAQEEWRESKAADFKALQEQMMAIRGSEPGAREKWAEIGKAQAEVMATAPKEDEAIAQVKALLTNEQLKLMEAEEARRKAEGERMQREMAERYKQFQPK